MMCDDIVLDDGAMVLSETLNHLRYLPACDSTNRYAKANIAAFGAVGAVYTTSQTAGRGRLGRAWENAAERGFYYTAVITEPLAQPSTLPLLASYLVCEQLRIAYQLDCQIKWPNDILVQGKKICGILCESVSFGEGLQGRGIVCGIGINLTQTAAQFAAQNLPHATSLAMACPQLTIEVEDIARTLALALTDFGFDRALYHFASEGFAPYRADYCSRCVNLGKAVNFDLPDGTIGHGTATDIDEDGQLVVQCDNGEARVFTGEVSVRGIYGKV